MISAKTSRFSLAVAFGFLVSSVSALVIPEFTNEQSHYGPSLSSNIWGVTPLDPGTWIPVAAASYRFQWLEPLTVVPLGAPTENDARFLRFGITGAVSPWYVMGQTQIGMRIIPHFEIGAVYQALLYLNSNVEQAMPEDKMDRSLAETWSADYYFAHLYKKQFQNDYSQLFGLVMSTDYYVGRWYFGGEHRFYLIDVHTANEKKSLDFVRMIPVHKKDFFIETMLWARYSVTDRWGIGADFEYEQTGFRTNIFGNYTKDPVVQGLLFAGPHWNFSRKKYKLVVEPGFLMRPNRDIDAPFTERLLGRVLFTGYWHWLEPSTPI